MNEEKVYNLKVGTKCKNTGELINFRRVKIEFQKENFVKVSPVNFWDKPVKEIKYWLNINELY